MTNLPLTFAFNTTTQADGYHELTAVAYEGSHVRTQKRVAQTVRIQNTSARGHIHHAARRHQHGAGSDPPVLRRREHEQYQQDRTVQHRRLARRTSSTSRTRCFRVAGTNLGLGLHPFYAIVTATSGKQYRTETKWLRLVGPDSPFPVSIAAPPPRLAWPATAGRSYDILSTTNLAEAFQPAATVTPSNSAAQWTDTNAAVPRRFYRVRSAN